jgi:hypothetical protein
VFRGYPFSSGYVGLARQRYIRNRQDAKGANLNNMAENIQRFLGIEIATPAPTFPE